MRLEQLKGSARDATASTVVLLSRKFIESQRRPESLMKYCALPETKVKPCGFIMHVGCARASRRASLWLSY